MKWIIALPRHFLFLLFLSSSQRFSDLHRKNSCGFLQCALNTWSPLSWDFHRFHAGMFWLPFWRLGVSGMWDFHLLCGTEEWRQWESWCSVMTLNRFQIWVHYEVVCEPFFPPLVTGSPLRVDFVRVESKLVGVLHLDSLQNCDWWNDVQVCTAVDCSTARDKIPFEPNLFHPWDIHQCYKKCWWQKPKHRCWLLFASLSSR